MSLECGDDVPHHRCSAVAIVIHGPVENAASKVGCDPAGDHGGDGSYRGQLDVAVRLREEVVYRIGREEGVAHERGRDDAHLLWRRLERISLDNYICYLALGTLQSGPIEAEDESIVEITPLPVPSLVDASLCNVALKLLLVVELQLIRLQRNCF